jgi:hypothetical protein
MHGVVDQLGVTLTTTLAKMVGVSEKAGETTQQTQNTRE